jgi:hypothetical protein
MEDSEEKVWMDMRAAVAYSAVISDVIGRPEEENENPYQIRPVHSVDPCRGPAKWEFS